MELKDFVCWKCRASLMHIHPEDDRYWKCCVCGWTIKEVDFKKGKCDKEDIQPISPRSNK